MHGFCMFACLVWAHIQLCSRITPGSVWGDSRGCQRLKPGQLHTRSYFGFCFVLFSGSCPVLLRGCSDFSAQRLLLAVLQGPHMPERSNLGFLHAKPVLSSLPVCTAVLGRGYFLSATDCDLRRIIKILTCVSFFRQEDGLIPLTYVCQKDLETGVKEPSGEVSPSRRTDFPKSRI